MRKQLIGLLGAILLSLALATPGAAFDLGRRALLGITAAPAPLGPDSIGRGVLAERVITGSAAAQAGVVAGDINLDTPLDAEAWDEAIGLNFTAARRLAESALPAMRRARWGRIITLTGSLALKRMNAATPAKAAISSRSRTLSIQVAADGITVNCVAPGRINTVQVLNRLFPTEEIRRREIELNVPAGRFGEPEEIAAVITFLASARASYVTGAMIPVDGGLLRLDLK